MPTLRIFLYLTLITIFASCRSTKNLSQNQGISFQDQVYEILQQDSTFIQSHSGFLLTPLEDTIPIIEYKSHHYFTPASNTKLLTFYTSLNVLGDRINGLKVYENEDSLIIWGTGDPSFLNPFIEQNDFISEALKNRQKPIFFSTSNYYDVHYGSGWSWDDYNYGYQVDKHSLPIYGNMVRFEKPLRESVLKITPSFFNKLSRPNLEEQRSTFRREEHENVFFYDYERLKNYYQIDRVVPFLTSDALQAKLLGAYLGKDVNLISTEHHIEEATTIPTVHVDSLYKLLLQPSDNFIAEQLLLNCGSELFDTLNVKKVIDWATDSLLSGMPDKFQWVDGSGLSRYNMTTPANMVHLLRLIYYKVDKRRLFDLLPTGGESGTIKRFYAADPPFIHAKTGSLRNNHSLSGYLIGDSGKIYIFSFMNSNYLVSNTELKKGMDKVLRILKSNL